MCINRFYLYTVVVIYYLRKDVESVLSLCHLMNFKCDPKETNSYPAPRFCGCMCANKHEEVQGRDNPIYSIRHWDVARKWFLWITTKNWLQAASWSSSSALLNGGFRECRLLFEHDDNLSACLLFSPSSSSLLTPSIPTSVCILLKDISLALPFRYKLSRYKGEDCNRKPGHILCLAWSWLYHLGSRLTHV